MNTVHILFAPFIFGFCHGFVKYPTRRINSLKAEIRRRDSEVLVCANYSMDPSCEVNDCSCQSNSECFSDEICCINFWEDPPIPACHLRPENSNENPDATYPELLTLKCAPYTEDCTQDLCNTNEICGKIHGNDHNCCVSF